MEMGISFKLSKIGKRYHPKPNFAPEEADQTSEGSEESSHVLDGAGSSREVRFFFFAKVFLFYYFLVSLYNWWFFFWRERERER